MCDAIFTVCLDYRTQDAPCVGEEAFDMIVTLHTNKQLGCTQTTRLGIVIVPLHKQHWRFAAR